MARSRCVRVAARRLSGNHDDAEDAVQEALIRAWLARRSLQDPARGDSWLLTICSNEALRLRAKIARRAETALEDVHASEPEPEAEEMPMIEGLAEADRTLLWLRFGEDRDYSELADYFGISETGVRVRIHRARGRLERSLLEHARVEDKSESRSG